MDKEKQEDQIQQEPQSQEEGGKYKGIIEGADSLSLGISMVVAVLLGVGIGFLLRRWTEIGWLFWVGVGIGIAAAILNVYKAYSKQYKEFEELAKQPRYAVKKNLDDDDEDY